MKALFSSFLIASLAALTAPRISAQHVVASAYSRSYAHAGPVASRLVWVPGSYATEYRRVWIPGRTERVWVEPVYGVRVGACGTRVLIRAGHWKTVHHPGHYETRAVRVHRPGHWAERGCR
jgi:hypothetical protein